MGQRQTTVFISNEDADALRQIADALNIRITKGPGTGEIGSIRDLNHRLALAGQTRFNELVEALRPFIGKDIPPTPDP